MNKLLTDILNIWNHKIIFFITERTIILVMIIKMLEFDRQPFPYNMKNKIQRITVIEQHMANAKIFSWNSGYDKDSILPIKFIIVPFCVWWDVGRLLNFNSQHSMIHKKSTIINLTDKILFLSHPEFQEKIFVIDMLLDNDYPLPFIFHIIRKKLSIKFQHFNNHNKRVTVLPVIPKKIILWLHMLRISRSLFMYLRTFNISNSHFIE